MSNEQNKTANTTAANKATTTQPKKVIEPTYTVDEFAKAPSALDIQSADLIRAAFRKAGKEEATIAEAKKIVNEFKKKEVK